ncbi:MAG TPA: MBOAT family O-acyltransferase [Thermoanaerobaculia bacterium]
MLFHTFTFAAFFVIVIAVIAATPQPLARKVILLAASYLFYGWASPLFLLPLLITTTVDFAVGLLLDRENRPSQRRALLAASIVANLGLLAWFKYFGFFADNVAALFRTIGWQADPFTLKILLPVGISFYTFHAMSYTIDVYRRQIAACRSPLDFALFITFFPVLVAGPILRARQFLPQLAQPLRIRIGTSAVLLIVRGYAKKVLIADNVAVLPDVVFANPSIWPGLVIWVATIAFAVQIYCDFSGYSDVARGLASIFGLEVPLNFDRPYLARNPSDFWRRWHISLSSWLRDYLFIPLGGSRDSEWKTSRNLMITMLLGGLWHGASWNFVLWGAMHGVLLVVHRPFRRHAAVARTGISRIVRAAGGWVAFQYALLVTWIAFRVQDFSAMKVAMTKFLLPDFSAPLYNLGLTHISLVTTVTLIVGFMVLHIWSHLHGDLDERLARLPLIPLCVVAAMIGAAFLLFWPSVERPFIYFQF